ncbi:MutS-related protein [Croceimicrobium sp.]|uniref:MutS-related protein n=1 Tax=Croceimicrobium sp. TaxID=2828340 RepID=UPI003BAA6EA9
MIDKRVNFLKSLQAKAEKDLKSLKKKSRNQSWLRALVIIALLVLSYFAMQGEGQADWFWAWLPGLALFLWIVRSHAQTRENLKFTHSLLAMAEEELAAIAGKRIRPAYPYKAPAQHAYARELDFFGEGSLHHHINRAKTAAGAQELAREMLDPDWQNWQARQAFFRELEEDAQWLMEYRALNDGLEDKPGLKEQLEAWSKAAFSAFPKWFYLPMFLGLAAVWISLIRFVWDTRVENFYPLLYTAVFNLVLLSTRSKLLRDQQVKLGRVSEILSGFSLMLFKLEQRDFKTDFGKEFKKRYDLSLGVGKKWRQLSELLNSLDQAANAIALVVLNALFLYHLFRLKALENWHRKHASSLGQWLDGVFKMEAYLSLANYQANHPDFCFPELTKDLRLEVNKLAHPLIPAQQRVANDFEMAGPKYIILTGSNMSGKSTFLRSLGVNMILSQMGTKVCASQFRTYPFQLLSSMNPQDDLRNETSYFQAEILRLRALLDRLNPERFSFFLLDEILRGTNSNDKQNGTRGLLRQIEGREAWGIIATHDVDIAHLADSNPHFRAAFFESKVAGEELLFDYKLREGICKTPNASLLMRRYGLID